MISSCGNITDPLPDWKYIHTWQLTPRIGPIEIDYKAQDYILEFRNQPGLIITIKDDFAKLTAELEYPNSYSCDWLTINYSEDPLMLTLSFTENTTENIRWVDIECHAPTKAVEDREYTLIRQYPKSELEE